MNWLLRNVRISEIAISQGWPSVGIWETYHVLCSNSNFYRLTCFHFVPDPHILGTTGSTEPYFDSTNLEKRRCKSLGRTNEEGGVNSKRILIPHSSRMQFKED